MNPIYYIRMTDSPSELVESRYLGKGELGPKNIEGKDRVYYTSATVQSD